MNIGRIKTVAIASLSAIALAASIAFAQTTTTNQGNTPQGPHRGGQRGERGWGGMRDGGFFRQLNLTDDQKAKMKQLRETFAEQNKPLRDQLRAKRQELHQASEGGTFNEALATQKLTEMASLQAKMMGAEFKLHQDMLSILTPEQKAQLEQSRAQFKSQHGGMRKHDKQ